MTTVLQPNTSWRGDPTFLPDVLKLFGVETKEVSGWLNRGHGDFGSIQGIMVHHTGSNNTSADYIARHPDLGLCSQIHLDRKGVATLCGVGIAYHAGRGSYAGWPTNNANQVSIGIEAQSNGVDRWPDEQLDAYFRICAAILWFLGKRATTGTLLGHWEYSAHAQGKWDPGNGNGVSGAVMDMNWFRAEVNKYIDNPPFGIKDKILMNINDIWPGGPAALNQVRLGVEKLLKLLDPIASRINGAKKFMLTDYMSLIDAAVWQQAVLNNAIAKKLGLDPDQIIKDAVDRDNGK